MHLLKLPQSESLQVKPISKGPVTRSFTAKKRSKTTIKKRKPIKKGKTTRKHKPTKKGKAKKKLKTTKKRKQPKAGIRKTKSKTKRGKRKGAKRGKRTIVSDIRFYKGKLRGVYNDHKFAIACGTFFRALPQTLLRQYIRRLT